MELWRYALALLSYRDLEPTYDPSKRCYALSDSFEVHAAKDPFPTHKPIPLYLQARWLLFIKITVYVWRQYFFYFMPAPIQRLLSDVQSSITSARHNGVEPDI